MRFALDTNAAIVLAGNKSPALVNRILNCAEGDIGIPVIVAYELFFGAFKSSRVEHNLEVLRLLLKDFGLIDFDEEDARTAGRIRSQLATKGTPIGPYDLLIAGQASARNLVLITNNTREFMRVPELRVEDWTLV